MTVKDDVNTEPRGSTPVPDPTILTTQQLLSKIADMREFVGTTRELLETRLDAMDTATQLNKEQVDKIPLMISQGIEATEKILDQKFGTVNEKFHSIETQFKERDTRTEQSSKDSKVAVDAALQAAKEAVGEQNKSNALANAKMEAAFTKQIDQITSLISTTNKSLDEKINDIKGRLDRGDGKSDQTSENKGQNNFIVGLFVTIGLALIGNAITLIYIFTHK